MPPAQLGDFCKCSYPPLDTVPPTTDGRCTPSSFMGAPRHTRRLMVEWYVERNTLRCWLTCLGERWLTDVRVWVCGCLCVMRVCVCLQALEVISTPENQTALHTLVSSRARFSSIFAHSLRVMAMLSDDRSTRLRP